MSSEQPTEIVEKAQPSEVKTRGKTKAKRAVAIKAIDSYDRGTAIGGITIVAERVEVTNVFNF